MDFCKARMGLPFMIMQRASSNQQGSSRVDKDVVCGLCFPTMWAGPAPGKVKTAVLCWVNQKHIQGVRPPLDIVIAADAVYLEEAVQPLIETTAALCDQETVVRLGYTLWSQEAHNMQVLPRHFAVVAIPKDELDPEYAYGGVQLYSLRKIS